MERPKVMWQFFKIWNSWCRLWRSASIPWAKGQLGLPYHCGGVRKPGTALAPSGDVVPGFGDFSSAEERVDGRMVLQQDMASGADLLNKMVFLLEAKVSSAGADFGAQPASPGP